MSLEASLMVIDYSHRRDGVLYHATVTSCNGEIRVTWTAEGTGQQQLCEGTISLDRFRQLWNTLATAEVFDRHCAAGTQTFDPDEYHCITLAYHRGCEHGMRSLLIPTSERDPAFRDWIVSFGATFRPTARPGSRSGTDALMAEV